MLLQSSGDQGIPHRQLDIRDCCFGCSTRADLMMVMLVMLTCSARMSSRPQSQLRQRT
jgi:hypothetical protein